MRVLGFGLQSDVDKLALLGTAARGDNQLALLGAATRGDNQLALLGATTRGDNQLATPSALTRVDTAAAANTSAATDTASAATDTSGAAAAVTTAAVTTAADPPPLLSRATRVLDLREVAAASETRGNGGSGGAGLAARLAHWAGYTLDKTCQRSDWARRPLTAAQVTLSSGDASSGYNRAHCHYYRFTPTALVAVC